MIVELIKNSLVHSLSLIISPPSFPRIFIKISSITLLYKQLYNLKLTPGQIFFYLILFYQLALSITNTYLLSIIMLKLYI